MSKTRKIKRVFKSKPTTEGAGVHLVLWLLRNRLLVLLMTGLLVDPDWNAFDAAMPISPDWVDQAETVARTDCWTDAVQLYQSVRLREDFPGGTMIQGFWMPRARLCP